MTMFTLEAVASNPLFQDAFKIRADEAQSQTEQEFFDGLVEAAGGLDQAEPVYISGCFNFVDPSRTLPSIQGAPIDATGFPTYYSRPALTARWFKPAYFDVHARDLAKIQTLTAVCESSELSSEVLERILDALMWFDGSLTDAMFLPHALNGCMNNLNHILTIVGTEDNVAYCLTPLTNIAAQNPGAAAVITNSYTDVSAQALEMKQYLDQIMAEKQHALSTYVADTMTQVLVSTLITLPAFKAAYQQRADAYQANSEDDFASTILSSKTNPTAVLTDVAASKFSFSAYTRQSANPKIFK